VSEALYERYKEALRRGHVAALRDRPAEAIAAYREASAIAPERALPHASLGAVLLKLGRVPEALDAYAAALERAPRDETALLGRADALLHQDRRAEAAEAALEADRLAVADAERMLREVTDRIHQLDLEIDREEARARSSRAPCRRPARRGSTSRPTAAR